MDLVSCTSAADTERVTNTESSKAVATANDDAAAAAADVVIPTIEKSVTVSNSNHNSSSNDSNDKVKAAAAAALGPTPGPTPTPVSTRQPPPPPQQKALQRLPSISTIPPLIPTIHRSTTTERSSSNQQQITVTTTIKSMDRYKHILQPTPMSFPLKLATTLLTGITTEFWTDQCNVYLVDLSYMMNWLMWCIHQSTNVSVTTATANATTAAASAASNTAGTSSNTMNGGGTSPYHVNTSSSSSSSNNNNHNHSGKSKPTNEYQRLQECIRTIALQYQLPMIPTVGTSGISTTEMSYTAPGPIDNRNLSYSNEHPLLLFRHENDDSDDVSKTNGSKLNGEDHYLQVYQPCVDPYASTSAIVVHANGTTTTANVISSSSFTNMKRDVSVRSLPGNVQETLNKNHTSATATGQQNSNVRSCIALPESFYELIRSIHGVLCDDYHSVSFQPCVANGSNGSHAYYSNNNNGFHEDVDDIVLYHHPYDQPVLTVIDQQQLRPIEFRRKIIYQVGVVGTTSASTTNETATQQQQQTSSKSKATTSKKSLVSMESTTSLMDKLLLEQQVEQKYLMVEVHPIQLYYCHNYEENEGNAGIATTTTNSTTTNSDGNAMDDTLRISNGDVTANTTRTTSGNFHRQQPNLQQQQQQHIRCGFVLISRDTPAIHAFAALQQTIASHKVKQCVRLWSQWTYNKSNSNQQQRMEKKNPTSTYDGYELIDMEYLAEEKIVSLQQQMAIDNGQQCPILVTLGSFVERHHITPNTNELDILIETRRTVNTTWPRMRYELSYRIQPGDYVDAQDVAGQWYEAIVREVPERTNDNNVLVHYSGWASKWDTKIRRRNIPNSDMDSALLDIPPLSPSVSTRVKAPAPLWSQSGRWRERIQVGDVVEIRDSSSLVDRPKWYKGIVQHIGGKSEKPRTLSGGAELELYDVIDSTKTNNGTITREPLLLLNRKQQILVEVEQERVVKVGGNHNNEHSNLSSASSVSDSLAPHPPYIRWVNLFGEEICKLGTHLKEAKDEKPVTLRYEYDISRKPVAVMKSHPTLGAGFVRESLRGTPPAPGSVGLHNLGNSCFLNSTVQCLNHISFLTQFFIQDKYSNDLNQRNPLGSGGNVAVAYASLLKKIWAGEHSVLVPRMLKQTVANFAPQFDNSYQHDSHEFCQFLMDGLHEDLNRVKTKPYVEELEGFGMDDDKAAIESWKKHVLRHDSVIVDHCQGMHRSHLTCPQCGRESIKFDVYSSISLPLPTDKNKGTIKLEDCIEKFMEAEQLDERDAYYCPNCRRHVCALKLIALWTIPDVLIFHLKRFTFDTCMSSGGMLRSKVDNKVEFPINNLDLSKIVLGPKDPSAPPIYNLLGVSEHIGPTANSGHYTATVRNSADGQWYRCNDSQVGLTSGEASITGGAYLLFYQRAKGSTKWGGMYRAMKELNIDPYGISVPVDKEGFRQVKLKKKKKI